MVWMFLLISTVFWRWRNTASQKSITRSTRWRTARESKKIVSSSTVLLNIIPWAPTAILNLLGACHCVAKMLHLSAIVFMMLRVQIDNLSPFLLHTFREKNGWMAEIVVYPLQVKFGIQRIWQMRWNQLMDEEVVDEVNIFVGMGA